MINKTTEFKVLDNINHINGEFTKFNYDTPDLYYRIVQIDPLRDGFYIELLYNIYLF